jgi:hypothetical protein
VVFGGQLERGARISLSLCQFAASQGDHSPAAGGSHEAEHRSACLGVG